MNTVTITLDAVQPMQLEQRPEINQEQRTNRMTTPYLFFPAILVFWTCPCGFCGEVRGQSSERTSLNDVITPLDPIFSTWMQQTSTRSKIRLLCTSHLKAFHVPWRRISCVCVRTMVVWIREVWCINYRGSINSVTVSEKLLTASRGRMSCILYTESVIEISWVELWSRRFIAVWKFL
jgi:hypothetical protein